MTQTEKIRSWVQKIFCGPEKKIFFELGMHRGSDTAWLAAIPGVTLHGFEPDPRNVVPAYPNVVFNRAAISDRDGHTSFILSLNYDSKEWTYSSSLRKPKNHLSTYPGVKFGDTIEVKTVSLDSYAERNAISNVDFIWADIQGSEGEMVLGGKNLLQRTRYLYTEYSDNEMYEGQEKLEALLQLLPDFRVIEKWPDDVLLINKELI